MLRFEEGRKLLLEITVTDVDLFQMVAGSAFYETPLTIPGATIDVIRFGDPGVDTIISWLEKQLEQLRT